MDKVKLFRLLKSFSPVELEDFGDFVHSIYFNNSDKVNRLYDYLIPHYPDFKKSSDLNKEKLFEFMYPDENYNDKKLRNRLSLMSKLAENYLIHLEFQKNYFDKKISLLKQLSDRNLDEMYETEIENANIYMEKFSIKSDDYYLRKYKLENLKRRHFESKTHAGKSKSVYDHLNLENENLFNYFIITLLKNFIKSKFAEGLINIDTQFGFYDGIIGYAEKNYDKFKDIPVIQILYKFLNLFKKKFDLKSYKELNTLLKINKNIFKKNDLSLLYTELYNYCKDKQVQGKYSFGFLSFEILKDMIAQGLMFEEDGFLHPHNYVNIAATAMRIEKITWAEDFINNFKDKVRPELCENAFHYNYASLYYIKGRKDKKSMKKHFQNSLLYLSKVKTEDFYYYTRIMNLQLRIYYELGESEKCYYLIDSYKKSLLKNKLIPKDVMTRYNNFINFLYKMLRYKEKKDDISLEIIKKEIKNTDLVDFKKWLLEKIEGTA